MVDLINVHAPYYDELILLTGFYNPRNIELNSKAKIIYLKKYLRSGLISKIFAWIIFYFQMLFFIFIRYRKSSLYFISNPPINVFLPTIKNRNYAYLLYDLYPQVLVRKKLIKKHSIIYRI